MQDQLQRHRIRTFPTLHLDDGQTQNPNLNTAATVNGLLFSESELALNQSILKMIPFAVVGSNTMVQDKSGAVRRARRLPWGTVIGIHQTCFLHIMLF